MPFTCVLQLAVTKIKLYKKWYERDRNANSREEKGKMQKIREIIKVFLLDNYFDFSEISAFEPVCDYFLFDTKSDKYGGSGKIFDWKILKKYTLQKPFFLSGGLGLHNIKKISEIDHPQLVGLDFNSQLEDENYKKITEEVSELIQKIRIK